jgi:hypothetical protein
VITDAHVLKALAAYEAMPPLSGREARMRAALEAVLAPKKDAPPAGKAAR